jgi:hypothetical protein
MIDAVNHHEHAVVEIEALLCGCGNDGTTIARIYIL